MQNKKCDKKAVLFYFFMGIIFCDFGNQLRILSFNPEINKINNVIFQIEHTNNYGASFGLFQNSSFFLISIALVVVFFLFFYVVKYVKYKDKLLLFSLTIFNSGVVGNLIERINFNYVVDYIKLNFINFPIFNCFDIMINIGIITYLFYMLFFAKENEQ